MTAVAVASVFRRRRLPLMRQRHELTLFADRFPVHVSDDGSSGDLSDAWTEEATGRGPAVGEGVVGVSTARNVGVTSL